MRKADYEKYMTVGYGVARAMQKIELTNEIAKVLGEEEKTARQIFNELKEKGYKLLREKKNGRGDFKKCHGWAYEFEVVESDEDTFYRVIIGNLQRECFESREIEVKKVYVSEDDPNDKVVFTNKINVYRVA